MYAVRGAGAELGAVAQPGESWAGSWGLHYAGNNEGE